MGSSTEDPYGRSLGSTAALATFQNTLYCVRTSRTGYQLWYGSGQSNIPAPGSPAEAAIALVGPSAQWSADQNIPGCDATPSPALAEFNGLLHCVYQGQKNCGEMWWTSFDGLNWKPDQRIPDTNNPYGISDSPALAVFGNSLYCIHKAKEKVDPFRSSGFELYCCIYNGSTWGEDKPITDGNGKPILSANPVSLAVHNGLLYCLITHVLPLIPGEPDFVEFLYTTFDGTKWTEPLKIPNIEEALEQGALASYNGTLFCLYAAQDFASTGSTIKSVLHETSLGSDEQWLEPRLIPNNTSPYLTGSAPTVAVYNNILWCAFGSRGSGEIDLSMSDSGWVSIAAGTVPAGPVQPVSTMMRCFEGQRLVQKPSGAIYIVLDGLACHVPDVPTYNSIFNTWDGITDASNLPLAFGTPLNSGAFLAFDARNGADYLISNGQKRHIVDLATLVKCCFAGDKTQHLSPAQIDSYPTARNIDGAITYERYTNILR
jgi:hypothetical protein